MHIIFLRLQGRLQRRRGLIDFAEPFQVRRRKTVVLSLDVSTLRIGQFCEMHRTADYLFSWTYLIFDWKTRGYFKATGPLIETIQRRRLLQWRRPWRWQIRKFCYLHWAASLIRFKCNLLNIILSLMVNTSSFIRAAGVVLSSHHLMSDSLVVAQISLSDVRYFNITPFESHFQFRNFIVF